MKAFLLGFSLLCCLLTGCSNNASSSDVQFAQTSFTALAKGDSNAEALIDFDGLKMVGMDVGAQYAAMPNETEKAAFRRSFVAGFSSSFQASGASADNFKNWRAESADSAQTVVAADGPKGPMKITVSRRGNTQRIAGLEIAPKSP